jgi:hypothetical protein
MSIHENHVVFTALTGSEHLSSEKYRPLLAAFEKAIKETIPTLQEIAMTMGRVTYKKLEGQEAVDLLTSKNLNPRSFGLNPDGTKVDLEKEMQQSIFALLSPEETALLNTRLNVKQDILDSILSKLDIDEAAFLRAQLNLDSEMIEAVLNKLNEKQKEFVKSKFNLPAEEKEQVISVEPLDTEG